MYSNDSSCDYLGFINGKRWRWKNIDAFNNLLEFLGERYSTSWSNKYVNSFFSFEFNSSWFSVDVEQSYVRFLGNLVLNLWDCGGQETFMECYFATQKDNIFKNVEVLIYVFDVQSQELDKVFSLISIS